MRNARCRAWSGSLIDCIIGDALSGAIPFDRFCQSLGTPSDYHAYLVSVAGMMSSIRESRAKPEGLSAAEPERGRA